MAVPYRAPWKCGLFEVLKTFHLSKWGFKFMFKTCWPKQLGTDMSCVPLWYNGVAFSWLVCHVSVLNIHPK